MEDAKVVISKRAARFLNDGDVVNLGIGMPEMVANYLPEGVNIIYDVRRISFDGRKVSADVRFTELVANTIDGR